MGRLISSDIPNLISGVSQQPWNVRLPTQAEEQVNCYSSVTDFLKRRPATRHIARLRNAAFPNNKCAVHHINRDENEKYVCLFTSNHISVYDLDGIPKTVNIQGSAMNYLASATDPIHDLRFLTINDYTFVVNRRVTVQESAELSPKRDVEALVFIKQASYNTTYKVTLDGTTASFTTLDGVAPADHPADKLSSTEIAEKLAEGLGQDSVTLSDTRSTFSGSFNGTVSGQRYVAATEEHGHYEEDSWVVDTPAVPAHWENTSTRGTWTVAFTATFNGSANNASFTGTFTSLENLDTTAAWKNWRNWSLNGTFTGTTENPVLYTTTPASIYELQTKNNTIWIRRKDGGDFSVSAEDTRSNTQITVFKNKVQRFSDLPTVGPRGYVVEVYGDSSSSFDNYYVSFVPSENNEDFGTGVWKETVKPGIPYKLDLATMPHALVREANGTFTFRELEWTERVCGDEKSAALPSFVGRKLNGIFFYRNRLSFLSDENVVMSEVGEFFNFFPTTVTTMIDSDRIDVAASHVRNNILQHAAIFSGGLLLFSDQCQFSLEHDTTLSNSTVSVKPVTEFEASSPAVPVSSGKTVFFGTERGQYSGVREYITLPDNNDQNDAADVTAHVPRYIRGRIRSFTCSTNEDVLMILSEDEPNSIYVYKYCWNGSEKIQSAWFRFSMQGSVIGCFFVNAMCYLVVQYADGVYLEKMNFAPGVKDDWNTFEYCIDRKATESELVSIVYDSAERRTALRFPYPLPEGVTPVIVSRKSETQQTGYGFLYDNVVVDEEDRTLVTVRGNASGRPLYAGLPYTSSYVFSTLALRQDQKSNAVTTGRLQLRSMTLNCANTGYLEIKVTPTFRDTSTYVFTGRELGHGSNILGEMPLYSGTIKCPLLSLNTQVSIEATSDSFLPFSIVNASWEGFYNMRAQRT